MEYGTHGGPGHGFLQSLRFAVLLRARRQLHDVRSIFLFHVDRYQPKSVVPVHRQQRPFGEPIAGTRRYGVELRLDLDHLCGTAAIGGRQLEGLSANRQFRRQRTRLVRQFQERQVRLGAVRQRHSNGLKHRDRVSERRDQQHATAGVVDHRTEHAVGTSELSAARWRKSFGAIDCRAGVQPQCVCQYGVHSQLRRERRLLRPYSTAVPALGRTERKIHGQHDG
jgi:hypothetical protein